jgi:hypothetical protein
VLNPDIISLTECRCNRVMANGKIQVRMPKEREGKPQIRVHLWFS